jgi:ribonuclease D
MPKLITSTKILQNKIDEIYTIKTTCISVDTEFVRQSSYFPKVGIIQIGYSQDTLVIDALSCDLTILKPLLFDHNIIKIFHSARQDLEIFYKVYGEVPYPLSDLQLSAGFLGFGQQVSLETLADHYLNIQLKKIHRYGDWLERPLDEALIAYAYDDAATIYKLYPIIQKKLEDAGRLSWTADLLKDLQKWPMTLRDPQNILKKSRHDLTDDHHIKIFYALSLWREEQAIFFDKPRAHIISDSTICALIKACPLRKLDYKAILCHNDPKSHALRHQDLRKNLFLYLSDLFDGKVSIDFNLEAIQNKKSIEKWIKEAINKATQNLNIPVNFLLSSAEHFALSEDKQNISKLPQWKQDALNSVL